MNEQKNTELTWWKRNKKKVFIIGGVVIAAGIGIVVFKNKDALLALVKKGKIAVNNIPLPDAKQVIDIVPEATNVIKSETVISTTLLNNGQPFPVKGFIRELPKNCHPSAEKLAQAAELGIKLGEHQTIVDSYMKNLIDAIA